MFLTRYEKGVPFSMKDIQKGTLSVKIVYKRIMGWTSGQSLPIPFPPKTAKMTAGDSQQNINQNSTGFSFGLIFDFSFSYQG